MSKKKQKKDNEGFSLPKVSEKKHPDAIGARERAVSVAYMVGMCTVWLMASFALFEKTDMLSMVLLGAVYFFCLITMYLMRAVLEAQRRYGRRDGRAVFYYTQMVKVDQKWNLAVALAFFLLTTVAGWLFRSPNLDMTSINVASSFYMGFICASRYKDEPDRVPYTYMEIVFLFITFVTNWIVFLL